MAGPRSVASAAGCASRHLLTAVCRQLQLGACNWNKLLCSTHPTAALNKLTDRNERVDTVATDRFAASLILQQLLMSSRLSAGLRRLLAKHTPALLGMQSTV
jgi:hypothetical protein